MNRRGFLTKTIPVVVAAPVIVAPAFVRASSLMAVSGDTFAMPNDKVLITEIYDSLRRTIKIDGGIELTHYIDYVDPSTTPFLLAMGYKKIA